MTAVAQAVLVVGAINSVIAICGAIITGTNPYTAAAVLLLAVAGIVAVHQLEHERRCRIAAGRRDVWARRDREAGA